MRPKKKDTAVYICLGIVIYILAILVGLHFLAYLNAYPNVPGLTLLMKAFSRISSTPFVFVSTFGGAGKVLGMILIITIIGMLVAMYSYIEGKRNATDIDRMKLKGSSHWMQDMDNGLKIYNKRFTSPGGNIKHDGPNNMIFTKDIYLSMDTRQTRRNLNVLCIGGSGAGKSRFFVKPNLCEMPLNCSFVCTDPSGELMASCGKMLEDAGYKIKCFNLIDMDNSNHYNPLKYIRTEEDVIILVDTILKNTKDPNASGEAFWEQAQQMMLQAYISALWKYGDVLHFNGKIGQEKTLETVMSFMRGSVINENSKTTEQNATDKMFEELRLYVKNECGLDTDFCLRQYDNFKMGAGKTLKNILISAMARLSAFDVAGLRKLTATDDLELDKLGVEKTALFINISTSNKTFNFVASMMYAQLFQMLYYHAEKECLGDKLVVDSGGEVVKIFKIAHFNEKFVDTDLYAEEEDFDVEEYKKNKKKKRKERVNKKRHLKIHMASKSIMSDEGLDEPLTDEDKYMDARDDKENIDDQINKSINNLSSNDANVKKRSIEEAEKKAATFVEAAKKAVIKKKGSKFVVKVNDEIIRWYGNAEHAIACLERLKQCKVTTLGLRLPFHVRFLMDEFANIGTIPDFTEKIATMRKYEISCSIILQNLSQLEKMYKDDYKSIVGNCDSILFLGSDEPDTIKYFSEKCGKTTVRARDTSTADSGRGKTTYSNKVEQRELLTPDEVGRLGNTDECLYFLRGCYPYIGKKYPYETHRNYKYTADADDSNTYYFKVPVTPALMPAVAEDNDYMPTINDDDDKNIKNRESEKNTSIQFSNTSQAFKTTEPININMNERQDNSVNVDVDEDIMDDFLESNNVTNEKVLRNARKESDVKYEDNKNVADDEKEKAFINTLSQSVMIGMSDTSDEDDEDNNFEESIIINGYSETMETC